MPLLTPITPQFFLIQPATRYEQRLERARQRAWSRDYWLRFAALAAYVSVLGFMIGAIIAGLGL